MQPVFDVSNYGRKDGCLSWPEQFISNKIVMTVSLEKRGRCVQNNEKPLWPRPT